jgi:hypothetical protein
MNCSEIFDFQFRSENIPSFVSVASNLALTLVSSVILYSSSKFSGKRFSLFKFDSFLCLCVILAGIAEYFSVFSSALNFCRFSIDFIDSLSNGLNAVVIFPTFYVVCIFKCRSRRQFLINVGSAASLKCVIEVCRFYKLCLEFDEFSSVQTFFQTVSLVSNIAQCSILLFNFARIGSGKGALQQPHEEPEEHNEDEVSMLLNFYVVTQSVPK